MSHFPFPPHSSGLVSVSFRQLTPNAIVTLAKDCSLDLIEWTGDIHVPPGDLPKAAEVKNLTLAAGLRVAAYGSYYRLGVSESEMPFASVLESAAILGAPVIRVWAGNLGSDLASAADWDRVCDDANRTSALASDRGIRVALEFHGNTLNDTPAAASKLWQRLSSPNLLSLWQPLPTLTREEQNASLQVVLPRLSHVHVFQWRPGPPITRHPLAEGIAEWTHWLQTIHATRPEIPALLEFVENDDPRQLPAEAETLKKILN
jgi:3-dehydroshikimate dehydratase